jgi:Cu/Ag efflux protein CusF
MKTALLASAIALSLGLALSSSANAAGEEHSGHHHVAQAAKVHQGKGVVEAVDADKGIVTMEHDAIESLRWPKMVMDFKAHGPGLLTGLKEGDRVEFDLEKMGGEYRITRIAPAK